jgi:hypothetical protein
MKCWVVLGAAGDLPYWNLQEPKPLVKEQWMVWAEHKYDSKYGNCLRCGARQ